MASTQFGNWFGYTRLRLFPEAQDKQKCFRANYFKMTSQFFVLVAEMVQSCEVVICKTAAEEG